MLTSSLAADFAFKAKAIKINIHEMFITGLSLAAWLF